MSDFIKFQQEVIAYYEQQKICGNLHDKIADPSPANLRKYCLIRLSQKLPNYDVDLLTDFFDPTKKYQRLEKAIEEYPTGKLKALQKFINGSTKNPDTLLVKLFAILIDYPHRPYIFNYDNAEKKITTKIDKVDTGKLEPFDDPTSGNKKIEAEETQKIVEKPKDSSIENKISLVSYLFLAGKNRFLFRTLAAMLFVAAIFTAIYFLTPKECMCWVNDQYIAVDCSDKTQINPVIAIDHRLDSFKKITTPDTLNEKDINRVWYSKINHDIEFFTGAGHHPIHPERSLKAATDYILEKYAGKNAVNRNREAVTASEN